MRFILSLIISILLASTVKAQSDLLILKKNNRIFQSFYPGSEIFFSTGQRVYKGYITSIENDSLFLVQYDIRPVPTTAGVYVLDTLAEYHFAVNYHNITAFLKDKSSFISSSGSTLLGGGILLSVGGLITWIFAEPKTRYYAPPGLVIGAAALAGIGYLMTKVKGKDYQLGKKYTLHYIKVK